ncbi:MAG: LiaF-related protein [Clostridium sp.]
MRRKLASTLMGVFVILIGLLFLAKAFGFLGDIDFSGWWTLFLIVPAVYSMVSTGVRWHNIFMLGIGIVFLLKQRGYIEDVNIGYIVLAMVAISIGMGLVTGKTDSYNRWDFKGMDKVTLEDENYLNSTVIFSGTEKRIRSDNFKGGNITTIFGGSEIDLSEVIINETIVIECTSIFGGIDIKLPVGYEIKEDIANIFGGTDIHRNKNKNAYENEAVKKGVIVVKGASIFSGIDIYQ